MEAKKRPGCLGRIGKWALIIVGIFVALAVIAAILPKKNATAPTNTAAILVPTAAPVAATRCLDVPDVTLGAIEAGLKVDGGGTLDPATAKAVQSKDFQKAYFIAAAIHGAGMGDAGQVGVWASNDLAGGQGMIYAVNATAVEFSSWGDGSKTDVGFSMASDGAGDAERCVSS